MKFDKEYLEQLTKLIIDNELTEISLEDGNQAITIRKDLPNIIASGISTPPPSPVVQAQQPVAAQPAEVQEPVRKGKAIVSPMVGMFYTKPSPDAEPFVKVGDEIAIGDTVCIIEAMKMMNEIEAEFAGRIVEICVADGEPVEFGQALMYVE